MKHIEKMDLKHDEPKNRLKKDLQNTEDERLDDGDEEKFEDVYDYPEVETVWRVWNQKLIIKDR